VSSNEQRRDSFIAGCVMIAAVMIAAWIVFFGLN
jgi:hypothetical protein